MASRKPVFFIKLCIISGGAFRNEILRRTCILILKGASHYLLYGSVMNIYTGSETHQASTSDMEYIPGSFPARNFAAAMAPFAKIALE